MDRTERTTRPTATETAPGTDLQGATVPSTFSERARNALANTMEKVDAFFRDVADRVEGYADREFRGIDNQGSKTARHRSARVYLDGRGTPFEEEELARRITRDKATGREVLSFELTNPVDLHLWRLVRAVESSRKEVHVAIQAGDWPVLHEEEKALTAFFERQRATFQGRDAVEAERFQEGPRETQREPIREQTTEEKAKRKQEEEEAERMRLYGAALAQRVLENLEKQEKEADWHGDRPLEIEPEPTDEQNRKPGTRYQQEMEGAEKEHLQSEGLAERVLDNLDRQERARKRDRSRSQDLDIDL